MLSRDYLARVEQVRRPFFGSWLVGGRGAHGPAPASASLHRLRRRTVLRGTVNPSSRQHVGEGANGPLQGALRASAERSFPPGRQTSVSVTSRSAHSHPPTKAPKRGGASDRFYPATGEVRENAPPKKRSRRK